MQFVIVIGSHSTRLPWTAAALNPTTTQTTSCFRMQRNSTRSSICPSWVQTTLTPITWWTQMGYTTFCGVGGWGGFITCPLSFRLHISTFVASRIPPDRLLTGTSWTRTTTAGIQWRLRSSAEFSTAFGTTRPVRVFMRQTSSFSA